jgi:hypothetical protein
MARFLAEIRAGGTRAMTLWTELQDLTNSFPQIKAAVDQR